MGEKINNAQLSFTCNQDWNSMKSESDGRFCHTCQKKVYDMTNKNAAYFIRIMQENNDKVCGRFTNEQLAIASESVSKPYWKRWAMAAMVFIGIGTVGQKANAQTILGKVAPQAKDSICDSSKTFLMGVVAIIPLADELKSLHEYMVRKCKGPISTNGWLVASFTVKKDGSLTNLATSEQLSKVVREEVLKALKKAPKWDSSKIENEQSYSLNLTFKDGKIIPYFNK
ncbi:MAG: hypothetical protein P0Y49_11595 [Candidatus Pedobacter colombiensis]|uniref:TonB C-terminal domain-containing protein n=1 Tax=Candidatus Pedobacter colombiensis TaxID=3121371 RepID=A0AAJ5W2T5_9SPHI|nr:hypothetical protein [Pedobacter sp.]WEK17438.1 MAG: hypothetical protein P0Y49_11595 [Pedobacter sp.]